VTGTADIFVMPTAGHDKEELLVRTRENKIVNDWSRDGQHLVFASASPKTHMDLWTVSLTGDRTPVPLLVTPYNEFQGQISPDGRVG
jgi:Tol biopolymer transport system component